MYRCSLLMKAKSLFHLWEPTSWSKVTDQTTGGQLKSRFPVVLRCITAFSNNLDCNRFWTHWWDTISSAKNILLSWKWEKKKKKKNPVFRVSWSGRPQRAFSRFWCHAKPSVQWINLKWLLNAGSEGSEMWRTMPKTSLPDSIDSQWMFRGLTWSENRPCLTLDWLPANCSRLGLSHRGPICIHWLKANKKKKKEKRKKSSQSQEIKGLPFKNSGQLYHIILHPRVV